MHCPVSTSTIRAARPPRRAAVAVRRVLQRDERRVRDRFDETGAEQRNRDASRDDDRLGRNRYLTAVRRHGKQLVERLARLMKGRQLAFFVAADRAEFGDRPKATDRRDVVTDRAARAIERGAEALVGGFDLEEIIESEAELGEFAAEMPASGSPGRARAPGRYNATETTPMAIARAVLTLPQRAIGWNSTGVSRSMQILLYEEENGSSARHTGRGSRERMLLMTVLRPWVISKRRWCRA